MPVEIGKKREASFDDPLGLLSDCHRRIERFLGVLVKLSERGTGVTLEADERASLEASLNYFRNSAPRHTADEEDSLFPRLRASERASEVSAALARLEGDHETAERDHAAVDQLGARWLNDGHLNDEDAKLLRETVARLAQLYASHIALEDRELFPLAGRILGASELAEVGQEMADRRGVAGCASSKATK